MIGRAVLALSLVSSSATWADSWAPPSKEAYYSTDKSARLTVTPRDLESPLAYFEDKVEGREPAGAPVETKTTTAIALLERRNVSGQWDRIWTGPLTNEVAPVDVVVANGGKGFVTFDNWHSMGYGPNVVTVYGPDGTLVRRFGLTDLFPEWFVAALPHSVSSIHWRGEPRISSDGTEVIVPIKLPSDSENSIGMDSPTLDLSIRLSDGEAVGLSNESWKSALFRPTATAREKCRADRDYIMTSDPAELPVC